MKINNKIFSLPPYLSTTWNNIAALHVSGSNLVVHLIDGEIINIPDLQPELIEIIFRAHASYVEETAKSEPQRGVVAKGFPFPLPQGMSEMEFPFKIGIGAVDGLGAVMQHNPAQAGMPPLPADVLDKIRSIARIIAPDDIALVPKPEPHCNCMHCQIARTINQGLGVTDIYEKQSTVKVVEEIVKDEELAFQQWEITQLTDPKLYSVANKLDPNECYNVYLGHPVGCTCGKQGCEHIVAVLKS